MDESYDVVVVGGGPAGLSGAVALCRSRRRVLVLDAGDPRNARAGHVHNYLTRDGMTPAELGELGRREVERYGGEVRATRVERVERDGDGFVVHPGDGDPVRARRLLVTTGLADELPDVAGLADRWGRDVLHCPYCHGWEVRDRAVGILATSPMGLHQAGLFRQLTPAVSYLAHTAPPVEAEARERLAARGIRVVDGRVVAVEVTDDRLTGVRLATGDVVPLAALVVAPRFVARASVLGSLGLEVEDVVIGGVTIGTRVPADPTGVTAVPGVRVAGNVTDPMAQVVSAAAAGLMVGAAINGELIEADTEAALAALRAG